MSTADIVRIASTQAPPRDVAEPQQAQLRAVVTALESNDQARASQLWEQFAHGYFKPGARPTDADPLVAWVLREAYLEKDAELIHLVERVRFFNERKRIARRHVLRLREGLADARATQDTSQATFAELETHDSLPPVSAPPPTLENSLAEWDEKLNTARDDAQLANIELQNALQKRPQTLQMLSNTSKVLHDTALAIIQKNG